MERSPTLGGNQRLVRKLSRNLACNTGGRLYFPATDRTAAYERVQTNTPPSHIARIFSHTWELDPPSLIITATGGAQDFPVENALKEAFCRGLVRAVRNTRAWVISGGTSAGVMDLIGRGFSSYMPADMLSRCPLVGVCTWGIVAQRDMLLCNGAEVEYEQTSPNSGSSAGLQPHHTHFLLVDDGSEGKFGREIEIRSSLEEYYSKEQSVPIVQIVLSGGPGTFLTVLNAVKSGFPVVIVRGTGNAADAICDFAELQSEVKQHHRLVATLAAEQATRPDQESVGVEIARHQEKIREIELKMRALAGNNVEREAQLNDICRHGHLVFFELSRTEEDETASYTGDFNKALLMAILKDQQRSSTLDKLRLCIEFNRVDVAANLLSEHPVGPTELTAALQFSLELIASRKVQEIADLSAMVAFLVEKGACIVPEPNRQQQQSNVIVRTSTIGAMVVNGSCGIDFGRLFIPREANDALRQIEHHIIHVPKFYEHRAELMRQSAARAVLCWWRSRRMSHTTASRALEAARGFQSILSELRDEIKSADAPLLQVDHAAELVETWIKAQARAQEALAEYSASVQISFSGLVTPFAAADWHDQQDSLVEKLADVLYLQQEHGSRKIGSRNEILDRLVSSSIRQTNNLEKLSRHRFLPTRSVTDLLIWSLLRRKCPSLAAVLLRYCNYPVHAALACSHWVQNICPQMHSARLQTAPSAILDECRADDSKLSELVLRQPSPHWNGMNCVHVANVLDLREFVAHDVYQTLLDHQWLAVPDSAEGLRLHDKASILQLLLFVFSLGLFCRGVVVGDRPATVANVCSIPKVKFIFATLLHMVYLLVYSTVCLDAVNVVPTAAEILLYIWTLSLILRECSQALETLEKHNSLAAYFHSFWNRLDVLYLSIVVAFALLRGWIFGMCRFERATPADMMGHVAFAHKMLAVNSILAYLRLLDRFSLSSALGPVLIMIRKMAGDVMALLSILFVFLIGFGLTFMVLLRPVDAPAATVAELLSSSGIFMFTFWALVGDNDPIKDIKDSQPFVGPLLLWIFLMVANVMLLNLLIAKMGHTYDRVAEDADVEWKFGRVEVIMEYSEFFLPPPFNLLSALVALIPRRLRWFLRKRVAEDASDGRSVRLRGAGENADLRLAVARVLDSWETSDIDLKHLLSQMQATLKRETDRQRKEMSALHATIAEMADTLRGVGCIHHHGQHAHSSVRAGHSPAGRAASSATHVAHTTHVETDDMQRVRPSPHKTPAIPPPEQGAVDVTTTRATTAAGEAEGRRSRPSIITRAALNAGRANATPADGHSASTAGGTRTSSAALASSAAANRSPPAARSSSHPPPLERRAANRESAIPAASSAEVTVDQTHDSAATTVRRSRTSVSSSSSTAATVLTRRRAAQNQ